ncbi:pyridoxal phosphate-dependent transferase, partial [Rhodotorula toruloides]
TIAATTGAEIRYYNLLPESKWEVDLAHLESQTDENTAFCILKNPSSPCGSSWSEAHLRDIAAVMNRHQVVVIADEVYAGLAWNASSTAASSRLIAPCLVVGAVSKRWLAPGWRLGWTIVHDPLGVMGAVRIALRKKAFVIQGPNSTMQRALPSMLANTPESFYVNTMVELERVGKALFDRLARITGLRPCLPQGAMYLICGYEGLNFEDDKAFVTALHKEERVFILSGAAFRLDGFMRFVTTTPLETLLDACDRLEAFCARHRKDDA